MKSLNVKRSVVAASMVAGVLAMPIATATPASAMPREKTRLLACTDFVKWGGYTVGPKVKNACKVGAKGAGTPATPFQISACQVLMKTLGVRESVAHDACFAAGGK